MKLATAEGFHSVEWREVGEKPTHAPYWERNRTAPQSGEKRWINVRQWHCTLTGGRLWLLYQPALSLFNGWDEHPHTLDGTTIVECEIICRQKQEWRGEYDYRGWIEVVCRQVIRLADIPLHFAETREEYSLPQRSGKSTIFAEGTNLIYLARINQDVVEWWIITKTTPARCVLSCLEVSLDPFVICNVVVTLPWQMK